MWGSFRNHDDAVRELDRLQKKADKLLEAGKTKEATKVHRESQRLSKEIWPHS